MLVTGFEFLKILEFSCKAISNDQLWFLAKTAQNCAMKFHGLSKHPVEKKLFAFSRLILQAYQLLAML